jgi:hypothetical protein
MQQARWIAKMFSPPAWGWSALRPFVDVFFPVFPTRVGMVRSIIRAT